MSEITYDYIVQYLRALHIPSDNEVLYNIEQSIASGKQTWPIITPEVKSLISVLIAMNKPKQILEIGAAVGYSSIFMSGLIDGHVTTIERFDVMYEKAQKNIIAANAQDKITILKGDAAEILTTLNTASYDMIFMDCAKGQYINFLPECIRLLKVGGLLITDNVLHKGSVAKSRYSIERRQRTTHGRLREFLWTITHCEQLVSSVIPIGDGVSLSYKVEEARHE
ncbi:MAG: methyltransferase [Epulopiscium sp. Nele67-Bin001]|nr:MAG: methyltransferase [Epulopiscium sp. Nuni2H_MBin001]OON91910.1 MAG: methyltransferase [Epulopiscium sp. Nele67-Bin001]